jgi:hypothetical protein
MGGRITLKDTGAENDYRINSPAGEYGILYVSNSYQHPPDDDEGPSIYRGATQKAAGLIYYQAGIVVVTSSVFMAAGNDHGGFLSKSCGMLDTAAGASPAVDATWTSFTGSLTDSTIQVNADAIRHRIYNVSFNNTTELNSTIYFCRANHNEFNYSSNPTYLNASKIMVKENTLDTPVSYITTIGLYSADSELLAVAKLSEPLKKDPNTELTLRVRLDY